LRPASSWPAARASSVLVVCGFAQGGMGGTDPALHRALSAAGLWCRPARLGLPRTPFSPS
jgi:hypothetical protein